MNTDIKYRILDIAMNIITPGNRFTQSKLIEEAVTDVLINKYGDEWKKNEDLFFECYEELRSSFRMEKYTKDIPYFYSMYFMLLNIPKVQLTLIQLLRRKDLSKKIQVLDVGSAVGTTAMAIIDLTALLDYLCDLHDVDHFFDEVSIDSLEGSKDNIQCFQENISYYKHRLSDFAYVDHVTVNEPIQMDVRQYDVHRKYDLIIASNILNEITYNERKELLTELSRSLDSKGAILVIEPASKNAAISLNKLKAEIVKNNDLNILGPCGNCEQCKDCWTFQTCSVSNGSLISYIDSLYERRYDSKITDEDNERMKWAYTIFAKGKGLNIDSFNTNDTLAVAIVGNRVNNSYKICDGSGKIGKLSSDDVELGFYKFGDIVLLQRHVNNDLDQVNYKINGDITANRAFQYNQKERFRLKNINEDALKFLLKRMWGFNEFREGQFELIKGALEGKDLMGILPTGAGKSICYQLPALLGTGVSIVVSPLKSLIKDQITNLKRSGFEFVDYIDSSKSREEKEATIKRFQAGSLKMLYLSPERLQIREFQLELEKALKNFPVDYFIIDEAHCASEWGHDFRPSYLKLTDVADMVKFSNILAVTATASPKVKEDVLEIFKIPKDNVISSYSLDRPELSLEVINLPISQNKDYTLVNELLNAIPQTLKYRDVEALNQSGAGIIFTIYATPRGRSTTPFGTEYIKELVRDNDIDVELYHSKLKDEDREEIQDRFKDSEFPLLVSTKGFGMGIDKENIRYIVHMCYSNSLEAYYQEAGRAGRDREHAHSVIIARSRTPECIRHQNGFGSYEPKCIDQWVCPYTKTIRCDYGMQARFISDAYKDPDTMRAGLSRSLSTLLQSGEGKKKFKIGIKSDNATFYQSALYYFQKFGIIKNYYVLKYDFGVIHFGVEWLGNSAGMDLSGIINQIVERQQEFKQQKYNMLQSMWEYVDNTSKCRRQFLMDYFEDKISYGEQGCQFCDIEGISEEKAISVTRSLRVQKLLEDFHYMMDQDIFDDSRIEWMMEQFEEDDELEAAKVRAMRYLEDYTDNQVALYFRCFITLERDKYDAYARTQANQLVSAVLKKSGLVSVRNILNKLTLIDTALATDIIVNNSNLTDQIQVVDDLIKNLFEEEQKEVVYKKYISAKLNKLNDLIVRGQ